VKGYALWHAARGAQKTWFVFLLIVNTFGILELVYLLFFRPKEEA
jgi:methionyl-tRNA synthetase